MRAGSRKLAALILAGGRSSRFGREKAMVELDGRPLIAWVAAALEGCVDALAVSARPASGAAAYAAERGWTSLPDAAGDVDGPLAGVKAGLAWAARIGAEALVTGPCDSPFLPGDMVARLVSANACGTAVARAPGGLQPLCALWPVSAQNVLAALQGHPPLRDALAALGAIEVDFPDDAAFANLNTPADYASALRCLDASPLRGRSHASRSAR